MLGMVAGAGGPGCTNPGQADVGCSPEPDSQPLAALATRLPHLRDGPPHPPGAVCNRVLSGPGQHTLSSLRLGVC